MAAAAYFGLSCFSAAAEAAETMEAPSAAAAETIAVFGLSCFFSAAEAAEAQEALSAAAAAAKTSKRTGSKGRFFFVCSPFFCILPGASFPVLLLLPAAPKAFLVYLIHRCFINHQPVFHQRFPSFPFPPYHCIHIFSFCTYPLGNGVMP